MVSCEVVVETCGGGCWFGFIVSCGGDVLVVLWWWLVVERQQFGTVVGGSTSAASAFLALFHVTPHPPNHGCFSLRV